MRFFDLKKFREEKELSQLELAELLGTSQQNISLMEKGKHFGVDLAIKLNKIYGISLDDIYLTKKNN